MRAQSKHYGWLVVSILAVAALLIYLGVRTIKHEALLAQSQVEQVAQSRLNYVQTFLNNTLEQKATRLDAIASLINLTPTSLRDLVKKDVDIEGVFILQNSKLVYPLLNDSTSQKERIFIEQIAPMTDDPSVLFAHSMVEEKDMPRAGWYSGHSAQGKMLIYWQNRGDMTIGFQVPYVKLISDVINQTNITYFDARIQIIENDRLLYYSPLDMASSLYGQPFVYAPENDDLELVSVRYLSYPLTGWQIRYEAVPANVTFIYGVGAAIMFVLLLGVSFIFYRFYREYTQSKKTALQQVNFVSQVSHELKTPLTNITLYAELLQEELADEEKDAYGVDVIISESRRLSRLIQNILSFTRTPKPHVEEVDVRELMGQFAQTFTPLLTAKGMTLVMDIQNGITLQTDRDSVSQIICNFLSNAEKYAASGKRVDLTARQEGDFVDIEVRDYGAGIPTSEQAKIFQAFYRVNTSITEGVAGTGIGLTISQQLAKSLGAQILFTNKEPGACFTLRLRSTPKTKGQEL